MHQRVLQLGREGKETLGCMLWHTSALDRRQKCQQEGHSDQNFGDTLLRKCFEIILCKCNLWIQVSKQTEQPSRLSTGREVETWVFIRGGGRGQVSVLSSVATIFRLL